MGTQIRRAAVEGNSHVHALVNQIAASHQPREAARQSAVGIARRGGGGFEGAVEIGGARDHRQCPTVVLLDDAARAERVAGGAARRTEARAVFENVRLAAVDRLLEKEIVVAAEADAVQQNFPVAVAVVGETVGAGVLETAIESDAIHHEMRAARTSATAVAAEFESVSVSAKGTARREKIFVAAVPGPAVGDHNRRVALEQIPRVVRIEPRAAADEDVARARMQLAGEAVGVAAACRGVVVVIGIAVEDEVGRTHRAVVRRRVRKADLQAGVAVVVQDQQLENVVAAFDFDGVVAGPRDFQSFEVPVVSVGRDQESPVRVGVRLVREIQQRMLAGIRPKFDASVCRAGIRDMDRVGVEISSAANVNRVARRNQ